MNIRIGDKNKIKNSSIGHQYRSSNESNESEGTKKFHEKHPILFSLFISIVAGVILLFSFWETFIIWIESLLK
ncbi:hypothetical protein [Evansella cellulosilytica]|uniref:Uncharacterized protein n=1 Tax=Evansella cellulosilytica (strain ATCC 21833 / DSM 2522 / FERM P-1141 / JCM 9156 / N-4) TaxID=649639 RepID=E6TTE1_EVAC2|nr:hypothetical protein [Evansella cellulosilytica]ADU28481.1 hypothetical protein Bcell_0192 [Evansella cellulosilytica DSM 2522]